MRTLAATTAALLIAALAVFLSMPAMSNGGLLDGFEFFALLSIGFLSTATFALVAGESKNEPLRAWLQALVIGLPAPFLVLVMPLLFCIAFQPNRACM